ncbi:hypothetical protein [Novosphingobium sp.]|uniref:hypothetical protein n=1 Tax=Novosphingobium sp. TaxID=1874826 RepID=UPI0028AF8F0B|nr:hypothetical protein [Novosphingobium sp.]
MNSTHPPLGLALDLSATGLLAGAVVHLAAWLGGPQWMAALGAPPSIVASAAIGSWPALLGTLAIAALLVGMALSCFLVARRRTRLIFLRGTLGIFAVILLARGLLVVPFIFAGQRKWRTPAGKIIVTGDWFAAGSLVVLAIGALICLGLYQTRSERRSLNIVAALPRRTRARHDTE